MGTVAGFRQKYCSLSLTFAVAELVVDAAVAEFAVAVEFAVAAVESVAVVGNQHWCGLKDERRVRL